LKQLAYVDTEQETIHILNVLAVLESFLRYFSLKLIRAVYRDNFKLEPATFKCDFGKFIQKKARFYESAERALIKKHTFLSFNTFVDAFSSAFFELLGKYVQSWV